MNKDKDIDIRQEEAASNPSRRKLLKALTAGGAAAAVVPSEWTKPALKSVLLPAHAQATGPTPGGGDDCASFVGWAYVGGVSFSMSVVGRLDQSCGQGTGVITVYNSSGDVIVQCQGVDAGADAGFLPSFSCSDQTRNNAARPDEGELVTFVAEFDNGCSCTVVRVAQ